jgi:hypothetical protein
VLRDTNDGKIVVKLDPHDHRRLERTRLEDGVKLVLLLDLDVDVEGYSGGSSPISWAWLGATGLPRASGVYIGLSGVAYV